MTTSPAPFVWPVAAHRKTYDDIWRDYRAGYFSLGFMWELAKYDDVFKAYLKRKKLEPL